MIKILIDGLSEKIAGIEKIVVSIINQFDDEFQFDIITNKEIEYKDKITNKNVSNVIIPSFKKHYFNYKKELEKLYQKNKYDFVWVNNTSKVIMPIFTLAKKYNVKTIAHSHGDKIGDNNFIKALLMRLISKLNERTFYKNLDICFACSGNVANFFYNKKKINGKEIHIIHNAIQIEKFKFNAEIREKYKKDLGVEGKIVLGAVGRLEKVKNPIFLLKLIKGLPEKYILLLVGDGSLREKVLKYIEKNNLKNRVILTGIRYDVNNIYQAIDILLLASYYEGLPLNVIEAQVAGLKCIVSDTTTKEVDVSDNVKFVKLNDLNMWKNEVLNTSLQYSRILKEEEKIKSIYSIESSAKNFYNIILNEYNKSINIKN